jgi:hypothetical protein
VGQFNQSEFNQSQLGVDQTTLPANPDCSVFTNPQAVTPSSYGQLRYRVVKAVPGIDQDLVDGYLGDSYQFILDRLAWKRLERTAVIQTVAPYKVGTVSVMNGSIYVTLDFVSPPSGASFDQTETGRSIRIENRDEYYEFTATGQFTGVLFLSVLEIVAH